LKSFSLRRCTNRFFQIAALIHAFRAGIVISAARLLSVRLQKSQQGTSSCASGSRHFFTSEVGGTWSMSVAGSPQ